MDRSPDRAPRVIARRGSLRALVLAAMLVSCDASTLRPRNTASGGACTFNDECATPLLCAAGRCRAPCRTDRDCVNGWRCLSAGTVDRFVCYAPDDLDTACVWSSHCLRGRVCSPERICRAQCRADYDCQTLRRDLTCNVAVGACMGHPFFDDAGVFGDVLRNDPAANVDPIVASRPIVDAGAGADGGTPRDGGADVVAIDVPTVDVPTVDAPGSDVPRSDVVAPTDGGTSCGVPANGRACRPGAGDCGVLQFSSGSYHHYIGPSCVVQTDGWMRCWGGNSEYGAMGNGRALLRCYEIGLVSNIDDATQVVAGGQFGCARRTSRVECWGYNMDGALGVGTLSPAVSLVPIPSMAPVGVLSAGNTFACSLAATGDAWCWGSNAYGQLGTGTPPRDIGGGALAYEGNDGVPRRVMASGIQQLDTGGQHACAVIGAARTVSCWGDTQTGAVGHQTPALANTPTAVPGLSGVRSVCAGNTHSCALMSDATVRCWGANDHGQLGRGTRSSVVETFLTPELVMGLTNVAELGCGGHGVCARRENGTVWCWGNWLALGNGSPDNSVRPTAAQVPGLTEVLRISADGEYCALVGTSDLRCWGGYTGRGGVLARVPTPVVF